MGRYFVFAGDSFYASGGWLDFVQCAESLSDAEAAGKRACDDSGDGKARDWWHVVDAATMKIVSGESGHYTGVLDTH